MRVVFEDSQGLSEVGVTALQRLISLDHVPAVIGDLFSSVTLAMAPVAERDHVVILSPTSSAPKLTEAGDYIFRNCASDVFEGMRVKLQHLPRDVSRNRHDSLIGRAVHNIELSK